MYCFARTWFAPEMPRPGCVWTHTLVVQDEDVARVVDFQGLNSLFRRPSEGINFSSYETQLVFNENESRPTVSQGMIGRNILAGLYGSDQKIVIPSESSQSLEAFVLAAINQQWPRLRRNFRFCTGSLSLRETEFDISISPPEVTHSIGDTGLIINQDETDMEASEDWVQFACDDLIAGRINSPYRQFLWQHGAEHADGRLAFRPLTETFLVMHSEEAMVADRVLSAVAHYFPAEQEAARLKGELFGKRGKYAERLGGEASILRLLVSHPAASAVGEGVASVHDRAGDLATVNLDSAIDIALLAAEIGGKNAQQFLQGFSEGGNWSSQAIERAPLVVVSLVLERKPNLIGNQGIWVRPDHMSILAKFVSCLETNSDLLSTAISSMIDANAWDAVAWILDRIGQSAAIQVFKRIDNWNSDLFDVPDVVYSTLVSRVYLWTELLRTDAIGPRSLRLLSAGLDSRSQYVRSVSYAKLLAAANLPVSFMDKRRSIHSAVFFLNIGLRSWEESGAPLVASSFAQVYDAAKNNDLDGAIWEQMEPNLAWYSPSWDRCARLIRTVARAFKERSWSSQHFLATFRNSEQIARAIAEIEQMWSGGRYLRLLKEAAESGQLSGTKEQFNVIGSTIH